MTRTSLIVTVMLTAVIPHLATAQGTPTPTDPPNGSVDQPVTLTLNWNAVSLATSYRVQVSAQSDFASLAVDLDGITGTSKGVGPLSHSTTYYWHVRANFVLVTGDWSSVWSFTTTAATPIPPTPLSPTNGSTGVTSTVTLSWRDSPGADTYRLQVSTNSSFSPLTIDESSIVGTSKGVSGLTTNTMYHWRINATNSQGTSGWSPVWRFTTTAETPSAPTLVSPSDGATNQATTLTLRWNPVSGAGQYRLQVSGNSSFTQLTTDDSSIAANSKEVGGLTRAKQYYWRVSAQNSVGTSGWSQIWSFTTTAGSLGAPSLESPPDGATNQPSSLTFSWSAVPSATEYHLQISTTMSFFTPLTVDDSTIVETSQPVNNLGANTRYYWRVSGRSSTGTGAWSTASSFTTAPSTSTPTYALNTTIMFPDRRDPAQYAQSDYKIVGIPGESNAPIATYIPGIAGADWQVYWDNGAPSDYLVQYDGGSRFAFSVGKAFWMIKKGSWIINFSVPVPAENTAREVEIPLHAGWNLITNALMKQLSWSTVQSINSVTDPIYRFDNESFSIAGNFEPFVGYYLFNATGASVLRLPSDSSGSSAAQEIVFFPDNQSAGWRVNASLGSGSSIDRVFWFGTSENAQKDWDRLDVRKPRGLFSSASIYFARPRWDAVYSTFASDIRPPSQEVETWEFEVSSPVGKSVDISFSGIEEVPAEFEIRLLDGGRGISMDLRKGQTYSFLPANKITKLSVMVGKPKDVADKLSALRSPVVVSLDSNYPNPFNLSTIIPFELSDETEVAVTIHNLLGQEIRTLFMGKLSAGHHALVWNAADQFGSIVASGVYYCKLSAAGERTVTRSMILAK